MPAKPALSRATGSTKAKPMAEACPLCRGSNTSKFLKADGKQYWRCPTCQLTYLEAAGWPTRDAERRHYLSHENHVDDAGYRKFLSRLATPLLERLPPASDGLDYGCGPGPALAHMLRQAGHQVALYDPFFRPDEAPLAATYAFVTCTEVAEHFHAPAREFERLCQLLRPGGWLGIMTCFQTDDASFAAWHYRRDPTHVVFYKCETLAFVAGRLGWQFESPAKDIALMRKPL